MPRPSQHVDHVLGRDVAGGALGVGAAAEARRPSCRRSRRRARARRRCWRAPGRRCRGSGRRAASTGTRSAHRVEHRLRLARRADADRVAERDLVAAHVVAAPRRPRATRLGRDLALVGAAEHAGDVAAHARRRAARAASTTGAKRSRLSAIEQLMFFCEKISEAAPNTATSSAPAASAASKPLQVRHQHRIARRRACARMRASTSAASAICGTHFGETKDVASIAGKPGVGERVDQRDLDVGRDVAVSFCSPSRGPTSTMRTRVGQRSARMRHGVSCEVDELGAFARPARPRDS